MAHTYTPTDTLAVTSSYGNWRPHCSKCLIVSRTGVQLFTSWLCTMAQHLRRNGEHSRGRNRKENLQAEQISNKAWQVTVKWWLSLEPFWTCCPSSMLALERRTPNRGMGRPMTPNPATWELIVRWVSTRQNGHFLPRATGGWWH